MPPKPSDQVDTPWSSLKPNSEMIESKHIACARMHAYKLRTHNIFKLRFIRSKSPETLDSRREIPQLRILSKPACAFSRRASLALWWFACLSQHWRSAFVFFAFVFFAPSDSDGWGVVLSLSDSGSCFTSEVPEATWSFFLYFLAGLSSLLGFKSAPFLVLDVLGAASPFWVCQTAGL